MEARNVGTVSRGLHDSGRIKLSLPVGQKGYGRGMIGNLYKQEIEKVMSTLMICEDGSIVGNQSVSEIEREIYHKVVGEFVLSSLRGQLCGLR